MFDHDISQGSLELLMIDLDDQQKYEGWFNLIDDEGKQTVTRIRLKVQFIWSRYLYFHDKCEKADINLKKLNDDINEINKYLELFNKPYGLVLYAEIFEVLNKKVFDDEDEIIYSMPKKSGNISKIINYKLKKKCSQKFFSILNLIF